jgi:hypothetical protein
MKTFRKRKKHTKDILIKMKPKKTKNKKQKTNRKIRVNTKQNKTKFVGRVGGVGSLITFSQEPTKEQLERRDLASKHQMAVLTARKNEQRARDQGRTDIAIFEKATLEAINEQKEFTQQVANAVRNEDAARSTLKKERSATGSSILKVREELKPQQVKTLEERYQSEEEIERESLKRAQGSARIRAERREKY